MTTINGSDVSKLIVACDAGMGSSVMLASTLRGQLKKSGVDGRAHPGQLDPARRRHRGLPRRSGRPGPWSRPRRADRRRSRCSSATLPSPRSSMRSRTARTSMSDQSTAGTLLELRGDPARRSGRRGRGSDPHRRSEARRHRRRRPVVRRRDARARAVGLDRDGRRRRHPARHQREQGCGQAQRADASSSSPTASTGTASR